MTPLIILAALASATSSHSAAAAPVAKVPAASSVCTQVVDRVRYDERDLADRSTAYANGAPQATQLATEAAATYADIAVNLAIGRDNHCSPWPRAISKFTFILPAAKCTAAIQAAIDAKDEKREMPECDVSRWEPKN